MSLLSASYEPFCMMDAVSVQDEYGGFTRTWSDGARFEAAATFDTSMQARLAGVQGVTNLYTIITPKAITLQYHDVCKRISDGKIFRVTSDGDDKATPKQAALDMRVVTAEEWTPTG